MYAPRQEKVKASCPACQATVTSWHEEDLIEQKGHEHRLTLATLATKLKARTGHWRTI